MKNAIINKGDGIKCIRRYYCNSGDRFRIAYYSGRICGYRLPDLPETAKNFIDNAKYVYNCTTFSQYEN